MKLRYLSLEAVMLSSKPKTWLKIWCMGILSEVLDVEMVGAQESLSYCNVLFYCIVNYWYFGFDIFHFKPPGNSKAGYQNDSCWPASAVRAATAAAPTAAPIDWTALRENRDKYEAMKWQGESVVAQDDVIITLDWFSQIPGISNIYDFLL